MRTNKTDYFMSIAELVAQRSSCIKRQVGCVAVNSNNHILATGYNGPPSGMKHCTNKTCKRINPKNKFDKCYAVHAEINAILQCPDVNLISKIYLTRSPCLTCTLALMNTSCTQIIYAVPSSDIETVKYVWTQTHPRIIIKYVQDKK